MDYESCRSIYRSGRYADALFHTTHFLVTEPSHTQALELAAICLQKVREKSGVREAWTEGNHLIDHAVALNELGCQFFANRQFVLAEHAYRSALEFEPDCPDVMTNLGIVMRDQRREREAEAVFRRVLSIAPAHARARNSYGLALWKLGRLAEAEKEYREAIRLDPRFRDAYNNLGLLLLDLNQTSEAEAAFRNALALDANQAEPHNNLGNALKRQGRVFESINCYRQAIALKPDYAGAKANLGQSLLDMGEYKEGWTLYESRLDESLKGHYTDPAAVPWPRWTGEPLAGKSLLIWPEQGFGDILQFCRYTGSIKGLGVKELGIVCPVPLARIFESLEGVDAVYPIHGDTIIPPHDYWCHVMSLPYLFGTTVETVPAHVPYLRPPAALVETWEKRLPTGQLKVGLAWAGNPRAHNPSSNAFDRRRSLSAHAFLPILRVPGVTFVSLQKGETTQPQIETLPLSLRPFDPMGDVQDFADTAAIVECLDLVITVDTSVAHIAGALNKPVWILSRHDGCWRWLRDRDDSPWYPSARLFRQIEPGNWDDVIRRVTQALAHLRNAAAHTRPTG